MSRWSAVSVQAAFKPIAGGYLFQSRNPWLIGPSRRYLVTEVQKVEIVAQVERSLRRALPWTALAMMVLIVISLIWLPVGTNTMYVVASIFVLITVVPHVFMIRTLAPLVAGLPTTTERMTFREQIEHNVMSAPYWFLILCALLGLAGASLGALVVVRLIDEGRIDPDLYLAAAVAVFGVPFGLIFLYIAMLKRKLARQAS